MDFVSTRVITDNIKRLVGFYEEVASLSSTWPGEPVELESKALWKFRREQDGRDPTT
jgi:hypothetical protein